MTTKPSLPSKIEGHDNLGETSVGKTFALAYRLIALVGFVGFGALISFLLGSVGYMALVVLLDLTCCPPLEAMGNFGQFGLIIIQSVPILLVTGLSFALIPFLRWWVWTCAFLAVFLLSFSLGKFSLGGEASLIHVTNVAYFILALLIWVFGLIARWIYWYMELQETRSRAS